MKFGYTPYAPNMCHHMFCLLRVIFSEGCGKVSRRWWETNHFDTAVLRTAKSLRVMSSSVHSIFLGGAFGPGVVTTWRFLGRPFWVWRGMISWHFFVEHLPLPVCRFAHSSMHSEDTYNLLICKHIFIYIHIVTCATQWIKQNVSQSEKQSNISRSFKPT